MSTKLTTSKAQPAYEMADSRSLRLVHLASNFERRVQKWLVDLLHSRGFTGLTQSQLSFLGALDCGPNSASQIANDLGITRQAVHKTVKELQQKLAAQDSRSANIQMDAFLVSNTPKATLLGDWVDQQGNG